MTKRVENHVTGDIAIAQLELAIAKMGWTSESIKQDYGEDLLVRLFDDGAATNQYFFIQSKSAKNITTFLNNDGSISYPVNTAHLRQWVTFRHPVIFTLLDLTSETFYWEDVQWSLKSSDLSSTKTKTIRIPRTNKFTANELYKLEAHVQARYQAFEEVKDAIEVLVERLHVVYGIDLDFDAEAGAIWLPAGHFVPEPGGGVDVTFTGHMARVLEQAMKVTGLGPSETFTTIMDWYIKKTASLKD